MYTDRRAEPSRAEPSRADPRRAVWRVHQSWQCGRRLVAYAKMGLICADAGPGASHVKIDYQFI
jgi:hypothetical protein